MELDIFKAEDQKLIRTDADKLLVIIKKDLEQINLKIKRSVFKQKWKEEFRKCIMNKCIVLNSIGDFKQSILQVEDIILHNLEASTVENCKRSFTYLYMYIEALIYTGELSKARVYFKNLSNIFEAWKTNFEFSYPANYLLILISAILDYFNTNEENARVEMQKILNHGNNLDDSVKSIIYYYLAAIDFDDNNFIDSILKLNNAKKDCNKFYYEKTLKLEKQIAIKRSNLKWEDIKYNHCTFKEFGDQTSQIINLQLNGDGSILATVDINGNIKVWDTEKETVIAEFSDNVEMYNLGLIYESYLNFSQDSNILAFGSGIGIVKIYDLEYKTLKSSFNLYPNLDYENADIGAYYCEYTHISFSESNKYILVVPSAKCFDPQGADGIGYYNPIYFRTFFILDVESGVTLFEYVFSDGKIGSIGFSEDERFLAAGVFGKEIKVWELKGFNEIYSNDDFVWIADPGRIGMTNNIVFAKDNSTIVYSSKDSSIKVIKIMGNKDSFDISLKTLELPDKINSCALEIDNYNNCIISSDFYSNNKHSKLRVWDINDAVQILSTDFIKEAFSQQIVLNTEKDEIWILYPPVIEIRRYSTMQIIKRFDPYKWYNSSYVLGNSACISKYGNAMAIANGKTIRFN